jgi:hypothetical protein
VPVSFKANPRKVSEDVWVADNKGSLYYNDDGLTLDREAKNNTYAVRVERNATDDIVVHFNSVHKATNFTNECNSIN